MGPILFSVFMLFVGIGFILMFAKNFMYLLQKKPVLSLILFISLMGVILIPIDPFLKGFIPMIIISILMYNATLLKKNEK